MTTLPDLEPCPFCGGKAELWRAHPENPKLNAWVACADRCLVLTQEFESDEAAIAHWNSRAPRSVPEAGKAVAYGEDEMPKRIWAGDFDENGYGHCVAGMQGGLYTEYVRADLASVPAPSGAEPIKEPHIVRFEPFLAGTREDHAECAEHPEGGYVLYADHLAALTSLQRKYDTALQCYEGATARREASEAEATSLRRKLEERDRIGKMMANAAYNIHQRAADIHVGFGLDDAIRSLKSVQEEWDRTLSGASE